jgi:protein-S-isoprenylcysteine O-methyltransferase Ste14
MNTRSFRSILFPGPAALRALSVPTAVYRKLVSFFCLDNGQGYDISFKGLLIGIILKAERIKIEGSMGLRKLRLNIIQLAFVPIILVAVFVRPSWSLTSMASFIMEFFGYLFLLSGLTIRIWCIFYIGNRKSKEIVTTGPYSLCRNPLYVGTFLLAIGVGLCFENVVMLLLVPAVLIPVHLLTVRMEESYLEVQFGEPYQLYKQKVPRFWPRFSNYNSPDSIEVDVHSIRRIAANTIGLLLLPQLEDFLEILHGHGILPVLWHFPN